MNLFKGLTRSEIASEIVLTIRDALVIAAFAAVVLLIGGIFAAHHYGIIR